MKKYLFLSLLVCGYLMAGGIDTNSVKVEFEGFKTPDMIGTKGTFSDVKLTFGKDDSTLSSQLKDASAVLSPKSIDMGDDNGDITKNIRDVFFKAFNSQNDIKVSFEDVIEGNNSGFISAKVTIGKKSDIVPMKHTIEEGKFVSKGQLDLSAFSNSAKALKALSDAAAGHMGVSWPIVDISLSADMAK